MHTKYTEKLKQINDEAKRSRANLKAFITAFPKIYDIADSIAEENPIVSGILVSDYWGGTFAVSVRDLDGFKGEAFVNLLFALEQTFGVEFTMIDHPEYSEKKFLGHVQWQQGKAPRQLTVRVEARLKTDSADCRRVVIGETVETVHRPTYKLVCSGDEVVE